MAVITNFQAHAKVQGDWFEDTCVRFLRAAGFEIRDETDLRVTFEDAGVEVDIIATNLVAAISFYITCKGSYEGVRPGCRRTDTLKKAIAEAYSLHRCGYGPVLLLTSHLPDTPSGRALLRNVEPEVLYDTLKFDDRMRLRWLATATEAQLRADLEKRQTLFTLRKQRPWGRFTSFEEVRLWQG